MMIVWTYKVKGEDGKWKLYHRTSDKEDAMKVQDWLRRNKKEWRADCGEA